MAQMSVFVAFVSFRKKKISSWGGQKSTTFQTLSLTKGKYLGGPHWSLRKGRVDGRKSNAGFMTWEPGVWPSGVLLSGNYTSVHIVCVVSTYFIDSYLKCIWLIGGWDPALLANLTRFLCSLQNLRTSRNMQNSLCSFSVDVMLLRSFLLWILGDMCFTEACSTPRSLAEVLRAHCQPRSNFNRRLMVDFGDKAQSVQEPQPQPLLIFLTLGGTLQSCLVQYISTSYMAIYI